MTEPNPFCESLPTQLRAWDATSLRSYMTCPRRYEYEIVEGWRRPSVHTAWGGLYHSAIETYEKAMIEGLDREESLDRAFDWLLRNSGEYELAQDARASHGAGAWTVFKPWDAEYVPTWRCTDEGPALKSGPNKGKPNLAKRCVRAKQPQFGDPPPCCTECERPIETGHVWRFGDEKKNRYTLLRALVWYVEEQPADGGVLPYVFPDGTPAVELSFQLPLPVTCPDGTPYILCGHMDSRYTFSDEVGPRERKTTQKTLNQLYFRMYSPDVQISTYDLVDHTIYPESGPVMLEATQTAVEFNAFQRQFIHRTQGQREEFLGDELRWIKRAEDDARAGYYPKNEAACSMHGGCPFIDVCNKDPSVRNHYLRAGYVRQRWNPIAER